MPTGSRTAQVIALAAVITMVTSAGTTSLGAAHPVSNASAYRVFFADDPDPAASELAILGQGDLRWIDPTWTTVRELSRVFDFYYASTDPRVSVEDSELSLSEFQSDQLGQIETTTSSSRWMDSAGGPVDGAYVKDLTVSVIEAEGGFVLHAPGTTADGQYRIPNSGVVYTLTDFRVDDNGLPANYCTPIRWEYRQVNQSVTGSAGNESGEHADNHHNRTISVRVRGDQSCYRFSLKDPTIDRSLWLGSRLLHYQEDTTAGVASMPFSIEEPPGSGILRVVTEVGITEVTFEQHRVWNRRAGWHVTSESKAETRHTSRVTDTRPVVVSTHQELSVRQHVIERESGQAVVVLAFEGPSTLAERRFWSRAIFEDGAELANVWGVYSTQRPHDGQISTNRNPAPRSHHFPTVLQLHVTARSTDPIVRSSFESTRGYRPVPQIVQYQRERLGNERFEPGPRVNLITRPVYRYDTVVIEDAPGPVGSVVDLHGDEIPLKTTASVFRETGLSFHRVNESAVRIKLFSRLDGDGLNGRIVHLSGTAESKVRTNDRGEATVTPTQRFVTAAFRGDDLANEQPVYHGPVQESVRVRPATASLMLAIVDFWKGLQSVAVVVVLSGLGWLWYESR